MCRYVQDLALCPCENPHCVRLNQPDSYPIYMPHYGTTFYLHRLDLRHGDRTIWQPTVACEHWRRVNFNPRRPNEPILPSTICPYYTMEVNDRVPLGQHLVKDEKCALCNARCGNTFPSGLLKAGSRRRGWMARPGYQYP